MILLLYLFVYYFYNYVVHTASLKEKLYSNSRSAQLLLVENLLTSTLCIHSFFNLLRSVVKHRTV